MNTRAPSKRQSRRQFGKWVIRGGLLVPFVAPAIARAATPIIQTPSRGMAGGLVFSNLGGLAAVTTNATAYTTGTITPTGNALILAFVMVSDTASIGNPTLNGSTDGYVGAGKTDWTDIGNVVCDTIAAPLKRLYVFRYMAASPSSGTHTFNWSAGGTGCAIRVVQFTGCDTSGTEGSGAVVQSPTNNGDASANPSLNMSALGSSNNGVVYVCADDVNNAADNAPETDWNEVVEESYNTPASGFTLVYRAPTSDNTIVNTATSRDWAIAAVEVKAA